jgi:hypothetical protein
MPRVPRLALAVVAGLVLGSVVNMGLVLISGKVIPPPVGADVTSIEGLKASIHLFEPKHFVFPFLAHGMGTFFGALIATLSTPGRTSGPAYAVGAGFLLGGVANVLMVPAPAWFSALDLIAAYLPAAWLAQRVASRDVAKASSGA